MATTVLPFNYPPIKYFIFKKYFSLVSQITKTDSHLLELDGPKHEFWQKTSLARPPTIVTVEAKDLIASAAA